MSLFGSAVNEVINGGLKRAGKPPLTEREIRKLFYQSNPDLLFRCMINLHFREKCSDPTCDCDTGVCPAVQRVINRMGPTWYAEGVRRIAAGAESVEAVFGTKWRLKYTRGTDGHNF